MTGPFASRADDEVGLAFARARSGDPFLTAQLQAGESLSRTETAIELTCLFAVSGALSVQPTLQRILSPAGAPGLRDATIGMLRFELTL